MTRHTAHVADPRRSAKLPEPSFPSFCEAVSDLLDQQAADKGYNQTGLSGPNLLYALVSNMAGGPGHALGEVVFKAIRYSRRRDPNDLLKIAAWSYLVWRFDRPDAASPGAPVTVSEPPSREER